ncbi:hypothetical protein CLV96_3914 [Leptospira meyeri]|uniref:HEPN AbiU2-like domain-containing protein n=2 Tax=Leptospira meyeri TaxID=29508 RepID=A0A4R8MIY9_LEPME|nr:hypothetical protein CLV96_3914 [Leptospira meyeri]
MFMIAKYEDRLAFFKYKSGTIHFDMALDLCEYFQQNPYNVKNKIYDPLLISLYTIYAKPFKQKKEIRLEEKNIPEGYLEFHKRLIALRDKFSAHSDIDFEIPLTKSEFISMNEVTTFTTNGVSTFGISIFKPNAVFLDTIKELCTKLKISCEKEALTLWKKYYSGVKVPDGIMNVNISKLDGPLLVDHPSTSLKSAATFYSEIQTKKI